MVGVTLYRLRKERGLTQDELAATLNVSQQTISKWETDIGEPDICALCALADLYGVSIDYLVGHITPQPKGTNANMKELLEQLTPKQAEFLVALAERMLEPIQTHIE
ncbi:MAG: helix-turn-helix transcriptional regulator [Abditibacteriota bacterium]|nr:helix-turn-helix transcriptional regulator [Abditibacteriota bacterium]